MIDLDLLKWELLTGMVREYKPDETQNPLTAAGILSPQDSFNGERIGHSLAWDLLKAQRDIDTFEGMRSPAGARPMARIGNRSARLARTFKTVAIPGSVFIDTRSPGTFSRSIQPQERVASEQRLLAEVIARQDEYMISQALQGSLAMEIDGLDHTVDYGITPVEVDDSWAASDTDIIADVRAVKVAVSEASGRVPVHAWCGPEVIEALIKNDHVRQYFASTPQGAAFIEQGKIGRFQGIEWHECHGTYTLENGTVTRFIPEDVVIFTPNADPEWGFMAVGTDMVPNDDRKGFSEVSGIYSFAHADINPPSMALFVGKVRLPIIRVPGAIAVREVFPT